MKALILAGILLVTGYLTYTNHFRSEELPTPTPATTPTPTPAPTPRLAPVGTHFTIERYSEVTESGVKALPAGTKLQALGEPKDGKLAVATDDGLEFLAPLEILTNDLDVRDGVRGRVRKDLEKVREEMDAQTAAASHELEEQLRVSRRELEQLQLQLEELQVSRGRAAAKVEVEARKGKELSLTGNPMASELRARNELADIERAIKRTELAIENLQLAIRREGLRKL